MSSERPIEPTEILPRAEAEPVGVRSRGGRHRLRARPTGRLPMVPTTGVGGVVVGGVAAVAALGGLKVAATLGRMLAAETVGRRPAAAGVLIACVTSVSTSGDGRLDWTSLEVRLSS